MADVWPVELAGVLMDSVTPDAYGVRWARNSLDGWDSPPVRISDEERTGRHGGFGSVRLYSARSLVLNGIAYCPDMATAEQVRDRLHLMPGPAGTADLIVHAAVPKVLEVVMGGEPRSSWPMDMMNPYVRFQIPLIAHDPFKRALTPRTTVVGAGSTVAATNDGTAAADLRVTLTSPGTVVLSAGGVTLTTGSLPAGAVIDTGATTVTADGASLFHLVTLPALWPALPAGGGSVQQAGTAALSIEHYDTYA